MTDQLHEDDRAGPLQIINLSPSPWSSTFIKIKILVFLSNMWCKKKFLL